MDGIGAVQRANPELVSINELTIFQRLCLLIRKIKEIVIQCFSSCCIAIQTHITLPSENLTQQRLLQQRTEQLQQDMQHSEIRSVDVSQVITAANRVLGDITLLNKERGLSEFSYTTQTRSKQDRQQFHESVISERIKRDKDAAIAALQQKIAPHIEGMGVTLSPSKETNWGFKTFGVRTETFYTFSQDLLHSQTKKVIAKATFNINHSDKSEFPFFSTEVKGKLISEIVMDPFKFVS